VDKISYVQGFTPWGWVIGTGLYVDDLHSKAAQEWTLVGAIVVLTLALLVYMLMAFHKTMSGGFAETSRHLHAMAEGDLTTRPEPWGKDESAELLLEVRNMQDSLRGMVARVRESSGTIVESSDKLDSGSKELSEWTDQTASHLERSASAMERISTTVQQGARHTEQAAGLARENAIAANAGGKAMHEVVQTMNGIRDSSRRIAEIIGTIDSIAFQTNMLALNAAVEAARAGEQGRGFAVVASEVRMLAGRSATASREIKQLIDTSVSQVEEAESIVQRAGKAIDEIVQFSQRVDALLGEVSTGAKEQSAGVMQVGEAVQQLDHMTQQNAALVEQTASAAGAMRTHAHELAGEVARFQLPED
jgi:methyl-accepting chemotaxis protein